jgi:hypothetical protein
MGYKKKLYFCGVSLERKPILDEKINSALLNAKYLMLKTLYLASAIVEKPIEEFACYKNRQLNPSLFPY